MHTPNWLKKGANALIRGRFPPLLSFFLHLPWRYAVLSPAQLIERLMINPSHRVLEVGAGSGFYSPTVARRLTEGYLELLDIQPAMLEKARKRLQATGLTNVGYTLTDADQLPFADASFDVLFLVTVLGELTEPYSFLTEASRVLKPDGLLSISEHLPDPDFLPITNVIGQAKQAGFTFTNQFGNRWNYTANFRKK